MSLTPRTVRTDLKCGKGAIPEGKKCHKGATTRTRKKAPSANPSQPSLRVRAENAAIKHGGTISNMASVGSLAASLSGNRKLSNQLSTLANLSSGVGGVGQVSRGLRTGNNWQTAAGVLNIYSGTQAASGVAKAYKNARLEKKRASLEDLYNRGDSLWAVGFTPDPRSDAFIGSNLYNKGKEAAFKARHHRPAKG